MDSNRKWTFIVSLGIGIGSVMFAGRSLVRVVSRWRFARKANSLRHILKQRLEDPLPTTTVVSRNSEWEQIFTELSRDLSVIPVLGFDCEWVNFNGNAQPVALIQLASHQGRCALVRVCCMPSIPESLKNMLADHNIIKVGVACWEDASKLKKDFGIPVHGVYDVRRLIHKHPQRDILSAKSGLSGLTEQLLGATLNKHYTVRCSDWEAEDLTESQRVYAARDAIASIGVCLQLIADTRDVILTSHWRHYYNLDSVYFTWARTVRSLDTKFHISSGNRTILSGSPTKGKAFIPTKPKNTRAYAARKSALYDNCILEAPDGQQLCTCDSKKAIWYVTKGRGEVVCENPMTVRLNFEPSGRPSSEYDRYYLMDKANKCVVCGKEESFLRKNIVPHEYRKHFPAFFKDHKSHDVLLLCLDCHSECNSHENEMRLQLAVECDAPVGTEKDVKMKLDRRLGEVLRAANALVTSRDVMPALRVAELEGKLKNYFEVDEVTPDVLERAQKLEIRTPNAEYVPHGLKVVRHYEERHRQGDGLLALERRWREHFLLKMKPQHLPALWSVEHHRRPEEKWNATAASASSN